MIFPTQTSTPKAPGPCASPISLSMVITSPQLCRFQFSAASPRVEVSKRHEPWNLSRLLSFRPLMHLISCIYCTSKGAQRGHFQIQCTALNKHWPAGTAKTLEFQSLFQHLCIVSRNLLLIANLEFDLATSTRPKCVHDATRIGESNMNDIKGAHTTFQIQNRIQKPACRACLLS